jgi:hypothetical protein
MLVATNDANNVRLAAMIGGGAVGPGGGSTMPRCQGGNAVALDAWQNEPMTLLGFGRCRLHAIVG